LKAIEVSHLSKKYIIRHHSKEGYITLRDTIVKNIKGLAKRRIKRNVKEDFFALKDISFSVDKGERIGVIGRNGSGKTTLLKLLSRITDPTDGKIKLKGRVASLLEVGTGFHPELTGRENIFLNGAVLGMKRKEINKKFDEIVAFAGTEKFLDTPVKRYSSGMYVRLAFSVAAHLEPEILLIDEVLAVGDAEFQKKCLGKMDEVSEKEGRTILFVSHNMNAIERLCKKVIVLDNGKLISLSDNIREQINNYLFDKNNLTNNEQWINNGERYNNKDFKPIKMSLTDKKGNVVCNPVSNDEDIWIRIEGELKKLDKSFAIGYALYNERSELLYWTVSTDGSIEEWPELSLGYNIFFSKIPKRLLNEGNYCIELIGGLTFKEWFFRPGANNPTIYLNIKGGLSDSPHWFEKRPGILGINLNWYKK